MTWLFVADILKALGYLCFAVMSVYALVRTLRGKKEMDELERHARQVQAEMNKAIERDIKPDDT